MLARATEAFTIGLAVVGLCFAMQMLMGCAHDATPFEAKAADYEKELVTCSAKANSLRESIACENVAREKFGRPPRPMPPSKDGGAS